MLPLNLSLIPGRYAVCRLPHGAPRPESSKAGAGFYSITQTDDEISVVCTENAAPQAAKIERGWRILKIEGPFEFSAVGILASALRPLAGAGVSVFAISTFDTDYVLVKEEDLEAAIRALEAAGHRVARRVHAPY